MSKIAIIGGTGFSDSIKDYTTEITDYGAIKVAQIMLGGKEVDIISRHNDLEAPHLVNYRGMIQVAKLRENDIIYAVSACGRLGKNVKPGHLGAVDDVDWDDLHRETSFCVPGLLLHASTDQLFSSGLRDILADAYARIKPQVREVYRGTHLKEGFHNGGTYFNIQGPAFTPPAREARLRRTVENPHYIGMTLVPEVLLAREMGIAYAALTMCVDHSNFPGAQHVKHADGVMVAVIKTAEVAKLVLEEAVRMTPKKFYDEDAHNAMKHSVHSGQVNLPRLRTKRPLLAKIIKEELESRKAA